MALCLLLSVSGYAASTHREHSRVYLRKRKQGSDDTQVVDNRRQFDKKYKGMKKKSTRKFVTVDGSGATISDGGDNGKKWQINGKSVPKSSNENNKKKKRKYPELSRDHHHIPRIQSQPNEFKIIVNNKEAEDDARKTVL